MGVKRQGHQEQKTKKCDGFFGSRPLGCCLVWRSLQVWLRRWENQHMLSSF